MWISMVWDLPIAPQTNFEIWKIVSDIGFVGQLLFHLSVVKIKGFTSYHVLTASTVLRRENTPCKQGVFLWMEMRFELRTGISFWPRKRYHAFCMNLNLHPMESAKRTLNDDSGKIEQPTIKEGVDFVFEKTPELKKIGSQEKYSEYLDTIFPESKVGNIVYHSSPNKIEKFRESMFGVYFSYSPLKYTFGDNIHSVLINTKNPLLLPEREDRTEVKEVYDRDYRAYNKPTSITSEGVQIYKHDASVERSSVTEEGVQIRVRTPEQIHILGSQQDMEEFRKFIENHKD